MFDFERGEPHSPGTMQPPARGSHIPRPSHYPQVIVDPHRPEGTTQTWLRDAKAEGVVAFNRLYEHVAPAVHAWATLRLRRDQLSEIDPQDIVQEVWLRAWRALDDFDDERTPFRLWIFRVAKLVLLEMIRDGKRSAGARMGSDTKRAVLEQLEDPASAISRRVARDDALRAFMDRVAELPEAERKLVAFCGLEGLPYAEVARRLDSTEAAVARRWQRLRARLAEAGLPEHLLIEDAA